MAKLVRVVRVYLTEGDKLLNAVINYLHNEIHIQGVTVFRAMTGYGKSGVMHTTNIESMSLNLPLTLEFFDEDEKALQAVKYLKTLVGVGHVISWTADNF